MPDAGDTPAAEPRDLDAVRAEAIRWLAPSVQHELSNSLGAIELLCASSSRSRDPRLPQELRDGAGRLDAETPANPGHRWPRCSRSPVTAPPVLAPVAIDQLLDEVLDLLAWFRVDVAIERDTPEGLPTGQSDPSRLRQLLGACSWWTPCAALGERPRGGSVRIGATLTTARPTVTLEVAYSGGRTVRPRSTRRRCCRAVTWRWTAWAARCGWQREDAGGRLLLTLPIAATAPAEAARPDASPPAPRAAAAATVLVCDDEDVDPRAARPDARARRDARRRRGRRTPRRSRSSRRPRWMRCSPTSTWPA